MSDFTSEKASAQYHELVEHLQSKMQDMSTRDGALSLQAVAGACGCIIDMAFARLPEDRRAGELERFIKVLRQEHAPTLN